MLPVISTQTEGTTTHTGEKATYLQGNRTSTRVAVKASRAQERFTKSAVYLAVNVVQRL